MGSSPKLSTSPAITSPAFNVWGLTDNSVQSLSTTTPQQPTAYAHQAPRATKSQTPPPPLQNAFQPNMSIPVQFTNQQGNDLPSEAASFAFEEHVESFPSLASERNEFPSLASPAAPSNAPQKGKGKKGRGGRKGQQVLSLGVARMNIN